MFAREPVEDGRRLRGRTRSRERPALLVQGLLADVPARRGEREDFVENVDGLAVPPEKGLADAGPEDHFGPARVGRETLRGLEEGVARLGDAVEPEQAPALPVQRLRRLALAERGRLAEPLGGLVEAFEAVEGLRRVHRHLGLPLRALDLAAQSLELGERPLVRPEVEARDPDAELGAHRQVRPGPARKHGLEERQRAGVLPAPGVHEADAVGGLRPVRGLREVAGEAGVVLEGVREPVGAQRRARPSEEVLVDLPRTGESLHQLVPAGPGAGGVALPLEHRGQEAQHRFPLHARGEPRGVRGERRGGFPVPAEAGEEIPLLVQGPRGRRGGRAGGRLREQRRRLVATAERSLCEPHGEPRRLPRSVVGSHRERLPVQTERFLVLPSAVEEVALQPESRRAVHTPRPRREEGFELLHRGVGPARPGQDARDAERRGLAVR